MLAVAQIGLVTKLMMSRQPVLPPVVVAEGAPHTAPPAPLGGTAFVPEIGQIAQPPPAAFAPPAPGSLAQQPVPAVAPPVYNGPPPIGSFEQSAPGSPALPGSSMPAPALPGSSMATPALPGSSMPRPALPGSSMPAPALPGSSMAKPALPGSSMPTPALPGSSMPAPALPGSSMATPELPGSSMPRPALPGSSMPTPALPGASAAPAPALPGSSMPRPALPGTSAAPPPPSQAPGAAPAAGAAAQPPGKMAATLQLMQDVNYVVTNAKELRSMSDMQGTLELLRQAEQFNPDHPAIIAEVAQTYEQMGIKSKATDAWRRIQLLGETKAGSYYELASRRLGAGPAAAAGVTALPGASGMDEEKHLRLGACQVERDVRASSGERYTLRVPIARASSQPVDAKAVNLEVFFFDRVNGTQVAQSIAPEPIETWQSAPADWSGAGEETLDVVYHLPTLSNAEIQQHGRRSYYGYMLRLYYNNKLQDVAAEPRDLLEFGSAPGSAPAGGNPLLPPVGR